MKFKPACLDKEYWSLISRHCLIGNFFIGLPKTKYCYLRLHVIYTELTKYILHRRVRYMCIDTYHSCKLLQKSDKILRKKACRHTIFRWTIIFLFCFFLNVLDSKFQDLHKCIACKLAWIHMYRSLLKIT